MRRVWPDSFVEEANLTVNISTLRKQLGEAPDGQHYIETIPKKGYRFAVPVSLRLDPGHPQPVSAENGSSRPASAAAVGEIARIPMRPVRRALADPKWRSRATLLLLIVLAILLLAFF